MRRADGCHETEALSETRGEAAPGEREDVFALCVRAPEPSEDALVCRLWELGTQGIEHLEAGRGETALLAYFPAGAAAPAAVRAAIERLPGARVEPRPVAASDWLARFREGFRAFDAGGFRIVPAWQQPGPGPDPGTLLVDPGRGFGTGTHESTRLCLAAVTSLAASGLGRVVDVGAGSGLLGIAALRRGARAAFGIDNDEQALACARSHAALNAVPLALCLGDLGAPLRPRCADTVLANLTASLLLERPGDLAALCAPRGRLVLAGFLAADLAELRAAYAPFGGLVASSDGEWASLRVERT